MKTKMNIQVKTAILAIVACLARGAWLLAALALAFAALAVFIPETRSDQGG